MEKFKFADKNKVSKLPRTSGVYAFRAARKFLYIGKAVNIKERVKNHFQRPVALWEQVLLRQGFGGQVGYIKTDSEIEALILESQLIKKYQPKYNTVWRDDKNYFYVATTREDFPEIFITHQPQNSENRSRNFIGPFVDGKALKETLKVLRKVFPYRTCHRLPKHSCLWYQLRRCPAPCLVRQEVPGFKEKMKKECRRNAENLLTTLKEGKTAVLKKLTKEMKSLSQKQQFEQASRIKDQIKSLEKIIAHTPILHEAKMFGAELRTPRMPAFRRAEAYDVANIQGKEATGAMVVFLDGKPDKSQYRRFKIKRVKKPNDIAMLKEVLERRLHHPEWPYPDLILIDGGKAQFNLAQKICSEFGSEQIEVMALAKKRNELFIKGRNQPVLLKNMPRETFNLILQLRDEAHRFARRYHHYLRKKFLLK